MAAKRRSSCLSSVLALLVPLVLVAAVATAALAQSPAAYWTFNDSSGTRATDSSGNGHTATLVNGVSWVPGEIGGAVSANATSQQYVSIPAIDLSSTKAVTVALWANRNYSRSGGHALFEASNDTNSTTGFGFFPDDATCNGIQATIRGNVGYTANCYDQPSSGVWHHLAVVFDKSQTAGNQVRFYVDGELQIVNWSLHATTNTNNFGNNPIYVFSRAGTTEFDSGTIDDFRIYNSALTTAQVQQIYNSAILLSLAVTPTNPSIAIGTQQQFTAIGTYKDGSKKDLSSSVTWTPSASSVATVSRSGVATARAAGSATIRAALGEINNTVVVTVTLATLVSIAVTPTSASIAAGQQQQFTATGTYTDGSHQNLTSTAVWTSSCPFRRHHQRGRLGHWCAAGSTTIKATSGSISGSTGLTVTAATLVSIAVTPANPSIAAGQQQQFTATGTYTDGSHQNLTSTATWTSSAPSVATISAGGLATGVAAGSTTITATSGSISGSTGLTVTATRQLHYRGLANLAERGAGQSRHLDDHDHGGRGL